MRFVLLPSAKHLPRLGLASCDCDGEADLACCLTACFDMAEPTPGTYTPVLAAGIRCQPSGLRSRHNPQTGDSRCREASGCNLVHPPLQDTAQEPTLGTDLSKTLAA